MSESAFIPGLELAERFFAEVVEPALSRRMPDLRYSAALIGPGSEVLGFDTPMSTDHSWGPRVLLFLPEADFEATKRAVSECTAKAVPSEFLGFPTTPNPSEPGGPAESAVAVTTINRFFGSKGIPAGRPLEPVDWLVLPEQTLRSVTAGRVFRDDLELEANRARLAYYPRDVWLYQLASAWNRIGQEEHLIGRAGFVGDELGSAIIAARLVRDLMRLCFLMERQYAPYPKWFGTAFRKLACAAQLEPILRAVLAAATWKQREEYLTQAYEIVAEMHNQLGITDPISAKVGPFYNRPFQVIHLTGGYAAKIAATIEDPTVKALPLLGGIDLVSDNTNILSHAGLGEKLRALYE